MIFNFEVLIFIAMSVHWSSGEHNILFCLKKSKRFICSLILCRSWTRHAAAPFSDDLQKRASHPAWALRFGFHVAIAVLLRCESLVPTCTTVLPTKRGDYTLDPDVPYVIRCEMKYHWKDFSWCRGSMKM